MIIERACDWCSSSYESTRPWSRFCSALCRNRACRARQAGRELSAPVAVLAARREPPGADGPVVRAIRAELESVGQAGSVLGSVALTLAARLDAGGRESGSGIATVARELKVTLQAARLAGTPRVESKVDELRRRREARAARGQHRTGLL